MTSVIQEIQAVQVGVYSYAITLSRGDRIIDFDMYRCTAIVLSPNTDWTKTIMEVLMHVIPVNTRFDMSPHYRYICMTQQHTNQRHYLFVEDRNP